ncbi:hypothetical protein BGZ68_001487, partial [Mortierella alpina]
MSDASSYWRIYTRYKRGDEYPNNSALRQGVENIINEVLGAGLVAAPSLYVARIGAVLEQHRTPTHPPVQPPAQVTAGELHRHALQYRFLQNLIPALSGTEGSATPVTTSPGEQLLRNVLDLLQRGLIRDAVTNMSATWSYPDNKLILDHGRQVFLNTVQDFGQRAEIFEVALRSLKAAGVHTRIQNKLQMTAAQIQADLPPEAMNVRNAPLPLPTTGVAGGHWREAYYEPLQSKPRTSVPSPYRGHPSEEYSTTKTADTIEDKEDGDDNDIDPSGNHLIVILPYEGR